MKTITLNQFQIGNHSPICLIAGPCVIESESLAMNVAEQLTRMTERLNIPFIFKSSFDKANRTSINSFRGPGLESGLKILERIKSEYQVPVLTDIHLPEQAEPVGNVVDIIQIPAFLCRQTDLLIAAANTKKIINVKKGQFLAPADMSNVVCKIESSGNNQIILTERGSSFGYNNLVVDMTGMLEMKKNGYPVVFDGTHSVQKPGGQGTSSGGNREYVEYLSRAATAIGIDGLFLETHPNPDNSLSDGPNMVPLDQMETLLNRIKEIDSLVKGF